VEVLPVLPGSGLVLLDTVEQDVAVELGEPAAKIFSPWLPRRLNLSGWTLPALATLTLVLLTGAA
jgi:hypothetical protein